MTGAAVVLGLGAGAAAVGTGLAASNRTPSAGPRPTPRASGTGTAEAPAAVRFVEPELVASIRTRTSQNVMQQFDLTAPGTCWITQSLGRDEPYRYTTVVARCGLQEGSATAYAELDAMTIVDGGHGLGLGVERRDGRDEVWVSLQGSAEQRDPDGGRLARFRYTPGTWAIEDIPGGVRYAPQLPNARGDLQEAVYGFDRADGVAVERMYDFRSFRAEQHTRRRISDLLDGVDRPIGRITLPVDPPTMQGFATAGDSLFRWTGTGNSGSGKPATDDPMVLEQHDWRTGSLVERRAFPTLGQDADGTWPDGAYEPEGCSVRREDDGSTSVLVGVATGSRTRREGRVYRVASVRSA